MDGAEALVDDLAGEIDVGAVLECDDYLRQAELRDGTDGLEPGQSTQNLLDRESDLLLDLLRAEGRGHGVDLYLHRRRVGESVKIEMPHGHPAKGSKNQHRQGYRRIGSAAKSR